MPECVSSALQVQVEYTVFKDERGQYVDEDHPQASAVRCGML